MATGVLLPEWKRFHPQFVQPEMLHLLNDGNKERYEKYVQSFGNVLKGRQHIGNIDGFLSGQSDPRKPGLSLSAIDLAKDTGALPLLSGLMKLDTGGRGKFHAMDESFLQLDRMYAKGFYLNLKNTVKEPLIELVRASQDGGMLVHHDLIVLEPGAHITILRIAEGSNGGMISDNVEIYAGEGSRIDYITLNRSKKGSFYTAVKRARVAEGATVNWYHVDLYESNTAMSLRSMLAGPRAESRMTGVVVAQGEAQKDMSYETFHTAPDTVTSVLVRAAVLDTAKVVYRALTYIASGSKRAKVEQAEKSIMLGEHARFDGIPSLWIDEDDVVASHSASSGMADDQVMFYLKSRGIPHQQAEKLITDGFIASLLNTVPLDLLKGYY